MDQLPAFGRGIGEILQPTFGAYAGLLTANADAIRSTLRDTYRYGPHPRQELDVYYPIPDPDPFAVDAAKPVLVWLYGGGFVGGDKQYPASYADGLILANVGHYFAARYGFTVVIPDYRLMAHGARYPSGGEDVQLTIDWIAGTLARYLPGRDGSSGAGGIDLLLVGNSAGGVHVATYLLDPAFADHRGTVMRKEATERGVGGGGGDDGGGGVRLAGVVLLGAPLHWGGEDNETLNGYFGPGKIYARSPMGLLDAHKERSGGGGSGSGGPDLPGVKLLAQVSELDPDFILNAGEELQKAWPEAGVVEVQTIRGHNHISTQLSLGTGIEREEAWGAQVADFFKRCAAR
ncbi:Alpha/Beta hydrolase protein [Xylariaceae sp. FL0804]|nr:Alpha/Beta hydrolase protein [Xylariaceae sp. FL0804]